MKNEIGMMILSGCNPLLGVSKKAIEALGNPKGFCLFVNVEKKLLAITPDGGHSSAVRLSKTSETQDYYWVRGLSVQRIMHAFDICSEHKLVYFPAKYIEADNALTCSLENSEVINLLSEEVSEEAKRFVYDNFHLKDRKDRHLSHALDIKCCKVTPRK